MVLGLTGGRSPQDRPRSVDAGDVRRARDAAAAFPAADAVGLVAAWCRCLAVPRCPSVPRAPGRAAWRVAGSWPKRAAAAVTSTTWRGPAPRLVARKARARATLVLRSILGWGLFGWCGTAGGLRQGSQVGELPGTNGQTTFRKVVHGTTGTVDFIAENWFPESGIGESGSKANRGRRRRNETNTAEVGSDSTEAEP